MGFLSKDMDIEEGVKPIMCKWRPGEIEQEPDYKEFDRPTAMRKSRRAGTGQAQAVEAGGEEYFDIPAFLRRQAD